MRAHSITMLGTGLIGEFQSGDFVDRVVAG
jgi:hypothetical protein